MIFRFRSAALALLIFECPIQALLGWGSLLHAQPGSHLPIAETDHVQVGASTLQIDFADGPLDLPRSAILARIATAASAVATYYGRFPVATARILVIPVADRHGILQGTTWGDMHGSPGFTRLRIGEHTTAPELSADWTITHELTHMAFPSMPDDPNEDQSAQHWIEEGLATYIEPVERVMIGDLTAGRIWHDMVRDMPQGEPAAGDQGLDHTHTWGRTYWGGAMFCLVADVQIRQQTHNRMGLQDALRAIVAAGGTIDHDWTLPQALTIGDKATNTHVLTDLYAQWKDAPVRYDLPALWTQLGILSNPKAVDPNGSNFGGITFISTAPLADIREAITKPKQNPIAAVVVEPTPPTFTH
jgi:hypothetical protein